MTLGSIAVDLCFSSPKTGSLRHLFLWGGEAGEQMLGKQRTATTLVSEPVVINFVYFTASPMFWGWIFQAISIKGGATPGSKQRPRFIFFLAAQFSKITLAATFLATSTFLRKYKYGHYFMEMALGNIIKWIYFILIYLKCA